MWDGRALACEPGEMKEDVMRDTSGWSAGWLNGVERCESPNFGHRPQGALIDLVVIHSISLPPGEYGSDAIERLFTNRLDWSEHPYYQQIRGLQVSAHFLIRRDGQVTQFVSCDKRAWHAGPSSWQGRKDCNDFSVGIELEGLEGELFEALQYRALAEVMKALGQRYPIAWVAGHEHVAPGRKKDPGAGFDWPVLRSILGQNAPYFPEGTNPKD
jgi:N-acetyl-anhydromuramoyl-L-alanine amidase